jgi:hypothetical protein
MNWLLIIVMYSGIGNGGVAISTIGGFQTSIECERVAVFTEKAFERTTAIGNIKTEVKTRCIAANLEPK